MLEAVAERHDVIGVVTQPDRPAGRGKKVVATAVKTAALARGLRVFTPERLKPFVEEARAFGSDAFVVASYGRIVPQALLDAVPIAFNVHPSLLPLYRGATPLQSAIRDGRTETGVTIIAMDAGMDTGDVLLQERTPLGSSETYGELHDRLAVMGAGMLVEALDRYGRGALVRTPQNASGVPEAEIAATLTRPLRKDDLVADWRRPPKAVVDHIRSLSPQPLARAIDPRSEFFKIVAAHVQPRGSAERVDVVFKAADGQLVVIEAKSSGRGVAAVDLGDSMVVLDRVIPSGKPEMDGMRFAQFAVNAWGGSTELGT